MNMATATDGALQSKPLFVAQYITPLEFYHKRGSRVSKRAALVLYVSHYHVVGISPVIRTSCHKVLCIAHSSEIVIIIIL